MTANAPLNRLAHETSPYLRQHAANPVDWYPWGAEALETARIQDKPIFLSVGYSSCHWCHVMAHESFEDDGVAALLNRNFICIKVDREEHPDIDALYMAATQIITQRGGWPNSVWLTPDGRPWYAGTYFPLEDHGRRIGFKTLLTKLIELWKNRRHDVEEQANQMTGAIRKHHESPRQERLQALGVIDLAKNIQQHFRNQFDPHHGGFGDAPKFPPHSGLLLLLRTLQHSPAPDTELIIERTLQAMAGGGIYDQIGGGFHRYSTDDKWLVPHFEKMLYDNALLLKVYARAATMYSSSLYHRIIKETSDWLLREMTHPKGGFYSALDADSDGEEGKYYTWSHAELSRELDADALAHFCRVYGILPAGNFSDEATGVPSGLNIPHCPDRIDEAEINRLAEAKAHLLQVRDKRIKPGLDAKVITGWNGLMISALAIAGKQLNEPEMLNAAIQARDFISEHLTEGDRLFRCWCETRSAIPAYLEDHAALALADMDLYEATGDQIHLDHAMLGVERMAHHFLNADTGELFMTTEQHGTPLMRMRDVYDQGSPSGTGLAVQALIRAGILSGNQSWLETGSRILGKHQAVVQRMPSAAATLVEAALLRDTAPDVRFSFAPQSGNQYLLTCEIPDGWHLNEMNEGLPMTGKRVSIQVRNLPDEVTYQVQSAGDYAWNVTFTSTQPDKCDQMVTVLIRYQPCSTEACLPVQETGFDLVIR